jgi:hypothetical protein
LINQGENRKLKTGLRPTLEKNINAGILKAPKKMEKDLRVFYRRGHRGGQGKRLV